uniref:Lymphocyte antigen 6 family member M5 n=1 Tax=Cyprinus carpio TaxID=7962 RepID=A0A8C1S8T8_CYPCA
NTKTETFSKISPSVFHRRKQVKVKDPPTLISYKVSTERGTLFHSPPDQDGFTNLSFSSVHSFHCRYKDKEFVILLSSNTDYWHLFFTVSLSFITKGHSLSCYECSGQKGSCANQKVKTCPRGFSKCMSTTAVTQVGNDSLKVKVKDCAADCASGSMNLGIVKRSSVCCNTDRCNVRDAPDPSIDSNGKKCYSCDGKNCSNTVSCSGSEDHCITSVGENLHRRKLKSLFLQYLSYVKWLSKS